MKAWVYAYAHRRLRKRDFRRLWMARINAARPRERHQLLAPDARLKLSTIGLDRKVLSDLAITDAATFTKVVQTAGAAK